MSETLGLFQEEYRADPWAMLCCVIMLNQTNARQLRGIHHEFFRRWPDPVSLALADPATVEGVIAPLGLQRRRARSLIRMSAAYAFLWDGIDPASLPGVGKYGSDSYRLFIRGELEISVDDKELKKYLAWKLQRS